MSDYFTPVLPQELIVKPSNFEHTQTQMVLKPTYGSIGSQYVRFHVHKEYSGADSVAQNKEVYRPIELCEIQNDRFTRAAIRVKDLSQKQKIETAPIYERFLTQKESNETALTDWEAATDMEKGFLMNSGVYTVEQLAQFEDSQLHRLGPGAVDLRVRARRHTQMKEDAKPTKVSEMQAEMSLLRKDKEEMAARMKAMEDKFFAQEAAKAAPVKKQKRHRRTPEEMAAARAAEAGEASSNA